MSQPVDYQLVAKKLDERARELTALLEGQNAGSSAVELDQSRVGRLSRMDAMQQQAMAQATLQRTREELTRIAVALRKIENGTFGICSGCEEDIDPRRLVAFPTNFVCLRCAEKRERNKQ